MKATRGSWNYGAQETTLGFGGSAAATDVVAEELYVAVVGVVIGVAVSAGYSWFSFGRMGWVAP